ncbi:MAG: hypothetical protein R3Y68_06705 [Rikenellaceae bacterium]
MKRTYSILVALLTLFVVSCSDDDGITTYETKPVRPETDFSLYYVDEGNAYERGAFEFAPSFENQSDYIVVVETGTIPTLVDKDGNDVYDGSTMTFTTKTETFELLSEHKLTAENSPYTISYTYSLLMDGDEKLEGLIAEGTFELSTFPILPDLVSYESTDLVWHILDEAIAKESSVATITALDLSMGKDYTYTYEMSNTEDALTIDPASGVISLVDNFEYPTIEEAFLTVNPTITITATSTTDNTNVQSADYNDIIEFSLYNNADVGIIDLEYYADGICWFLAADPVIADPITPTLITDGGSITSDMESEECLYEISFGYTAAVGEEYPLLIDATNGTISYNPNYVCEYTELVKPTVTVTRGNVTATIQNVAQITLMRETLSVSYTKTEDTWVFIGDYSTKKTDFGITVTYDGELLVAGTDFTYSSGGDNPETVGINEDEDIIVQSTGMVWSQAITPRTDGLMIKPLIKITQANAANAWSIILDDFTIYNDAEIDLDGKEVEFEIVPVESSVTWMTGGLNVNGKKTIPKPEVKVKIDGVDYNNSIGKFYIGTDVADNTATALNETNYISSIVDGVIYSKAYDNYGTGTIRPTYKILLLHSDDWSREGVDGGVDIEITDGADNVITAMYGNDETCDVEWASSSDSSIEMTIDAPTTISDDSNSYEVGTGKSYTFTAVKDNLVTNDDESALLSVSADGVISVKDGASLTNVSLVKPLLEMSDSNGNVYEVETNISITVKAHVVIAEYDPTAYTWYSDTSSYVTDIPLYVSVDGVKETMRAYNDAVAAGVTEYYLIHKSVVNNADTDIDENAVLQSNSYGEILIKSDFASSVGVIKPSLTLWKYEIKEGATAGSKVWTQEFTPDLTITVINEPTPSTPGEDVDPTTPDSTVANYSTTTLSWNVADDSASTSVVPSAITIDEESVTPGADDSDYEYVGVADNTETNEVDESLYLNVTATGVISLNNDNVADLEVGTYTLKPVLTLKNTADDSEISMSTDLVITLEQPAADDPSVITAMYGNEATYAVEWASSKDIAKATCTPTTIEDKDTTYTVGESGAYNFTAVKDNPATTDVDESALLEVSADGVISAKTDVDLTVGEIIIPLLEMSDSNSNVYEVETNISITVKVHAVVVTYNPNAYTWYSDTDSYATSKPETVFIDGEEVTLLAFKDASEAGITTYYSINKTTYDNAETAATEGGTLISDAYGVIKDNAKISTDITSYVGEYRPTLRLIKYEIVDGEDGTAATAGTKLWQQDFTPNLTITVSNEQTPTIPGGDVEPTTPDSTVANYSTTTLSWNVVDDSASTSVAPSAITINEESVTPGADDSNCEYVGVADNSETNEVDESLYLNVTTTGVISLNNDNVADLAAGTYTLKPILTLKDTTTNAEISMSTDLVITLEQPEAVVDVFTLTYSATNEWSFTTTEVADMKVEPSTFNNAKKNVTFAIEDNASTANYNESELLEISESGVISVKQESEGVYPELLVGAIKPIVVVADNDDNSELMRVEDLTITVMPHVVVATYAPNAYTWYSDSESYATAVPTTITLDGREVDLYSSKDASTAGLTEYYSINGSVLDNTETEGVTESAILSATVSGSIGFKSGVTTETESSAGDHKPKLRFIKYKFIDGVATKLWQYDFTPDLTITITNESAPTTSEPVEITLTYADAAEWLLSTPADMKVEATAFDMGGNSVTLTIEDNSTTESVNESELLEISADGTITVKTGVTLTAGELNPIVVATDSGNVELTRITNLTITVTDDSTSTETTDPVVVLEYADDITNYDWSEYTLENTTVKYKIATPSKVTVNKVEVTISTANPNNGEPYYMFVKNKVYNASGSVESLLSGQTSGAIWSLLEKDYTVGVVYYPYLRLYKYNSDGVVEESYDVELPYTITIIE